MKPFKLIMFISICHLVGSIHAKCLNFTWMLADPTPMLTFSSYAFHIYTHIYDSRLFIDMKAKLRRNKLSFLSGSQFLDWQTLPNVCPRIYDVIQPWFFIIIIILIFTFWPCSVACGVLVPWLEIKPAPLASLRTGLTSRLKKRLQG